MAVVVGAILLLAVVVGVYAHAARENLPAWGTEAEQTWEDDIAEALQRLNDGTAGDPVSVTLPRPLSPDTMSIPLVGRIEPIMPQGVLSFRPNCAMFAASHVSKGETVVDFAAANHGCLELRASTTYTAPFIYVREHGGLIRIQDGKAVVVAGPSVSVEPTSTMLYELRLTTRTLTGAPQSVTLGGADGRIAMTPLGSAAEPAAPPNAERLTWELTSAYPAAWKSRYDDTLARAGLVASRASPPPGVSAADFTVTCMPVDCSRGPSGVGVVTVKIEGPRTDRQDLALSITHVVDDVVFG